MLLKDYVRDLVETLVYFYGEDYRLDIERQAWDDPMELTSKLLSSIATLDMVDTDLDFRDNDQFEEDGRREYQAYLKELERSAWKVGD